MVRQLRIIAPREQLPRESRRLTQLDLTPRDLFTEQPEKASNCEMWGKGVCDIWEKWVVWVEKSNTASRANPSHVPHPSY